jgi:cathepsin A (carboxypeptidase C)
MIKYIMSMILICITLFTISTIQHDIFLGEQFETGAYKTGRYDNDLFYILFKARNKQVKSPPLLLWLNGGPGCSSFFGAFAENGPLLITLTSPVNVTSNPYSWNNEFDIIYVDSPSGTGFSKLYADQCNDTNCTVKDIYVFLNKFFLEHTDYLGIDLYLAGESYAAHYIPVLAEYILKQNTTLLFNLKGVAIGDGWFDGVSQMFGYSLFAYEKRLISFWRFIAAYAICIIAKLFFIFGYAETGRYFSDTLGFNFIVNGKFDMYDYMRKELPPYEHSLIEFLNNPVVVETLNTTGRPYFKIGDNEACNETLYFSAEDDFESIVSRVQYMIDSNLKVLIYTGSYDAICNVKMQELWIKKLQWAGHDTLVYEPYINWIINSTVYGEYKKYQNFMHLVVYNASHMAPIEQPYATLQMINHFVLDHIQ